MTAETAFTSFPVLLTDRLVLRQMRSTDAPAIFKIFSNPDVVEFGSTPLFSSLADAESYTQRAQNGYDMRQSLRWGVTLQGENIVIGTCGLHHFGRGFHCVETGYNLHRAHWGQGIISEAMTAVLTYGFTDFGCHRIEAVIDNANVRSKHIALKLGFTYEGTLRQRYPIKGRFEDENYYGLLRSEWLLNQQSKTSV
jgi:ribosomal-protein-alanine N-acetyltransferase